MKLVDVKELVRIFHHGQVDKQGVDYYLHPLAVAKNVSSLWVKYGDAILASLGHRVDYQDLENAALLHDVAEDTFVTLEDLRSLGFSDVTMEIVSLMSCDMVERKTNPDGTKKPYTQRVQEIIDSGNKLAMLVKLADNLHNDDPSRRLEWTHKKYVKTIPMLVEALGIPVEDFKEYF